MDDIEVIVNGKKAKCMIEVDPEKPEEEFITFETGQEEEVIFAWVQNGDTLDHLYTVCHQNLEVILTEGIRQINYRAFERTENLTRVTLPSTLAVIGENAFSGCQSLRAVQGMENTKVTAIPSGCFRECESLEEIHLPRTLTRIDIHAFFCCSSLRYVHGLRDTMVTTIRHFAFGQCKDLREISLPPSLERLGSSVFSDCANLRQVEGLETTSLWEIPEYTFYCCRQLSQLSLPSSLVRIGEQAIYDTALACLTLPAGLCEAARNSFVRIPDLHCSLSSLEVLLRSTRVAPMDQAITLSMPDGALKRLPGMKFSQERTPLLLAALSGDSEEDWVRAVNVIVNTHGVTDRIWLLQCLSDQFLSGEAKVLAEKTVRRHAGKAVKAAYQRGCIREAREILGRNTITKNAQEQLLALANEKNDVPFAALVLEAGQRGNRTGTKSSSFPL